MFNKIVKKFFPQGYRIICTSTNMGLWKILAQRLEIQEAFLMGLEVLFFSDFYLSESLGFFFLLRKQPGEWRKQHFRASKCKNFPGEHAPRPLPRGLCLWRLAVPPAQRWLLTLTTQLSTSKLSDNPGVVHRGCPWTGTACFVYIFSLNFKRTLKTNRCISLL